MVQQWDSGHFSANITLVGSPALTAENAITTGGGGSGVGTEVFTVPNSGVGFYWEITGTGPGWTNDNATSTGVGNTSISLTSFIGADANGVGLFIGDGWYNANARILATPNLTVAAFNAASGLMGLAWDVTNKLIYLRIGTTGNWNGSGTANPATQTGGAAVASTGALGPALCIELAGTVNGNVAVAAFAQNSWQGSAPSGFGPFDPAAFSAWGWDIDYRTPGRVFVFLPPQKPDQQMNPTWNAVLVPKLNTWEPFPQFARKHTAPTRAWARLDEQVHPTWNAVLIPKLQSWELPIQFAMRLFGQSKPQPDVPSFVSAPVVQPYGFDFIVQRASRIIWKFKSQPETPSFIPQLSILDAVIQFTSRLLSRRPQVENPIVVPVVAAPRMDLELFPRRLITVDRPTPGDPVSPATPVAPTMAFDREQFPARLEFTPRIQQFETYIIIIATQILQLTLVAWKWVAQTPSLAFTLTGSLVAWIWKAQAAILTQTMIATLVAWVWKPFAALFVQTIVATHAVWKWLPQAALLALSLGFSAPGVVWRWLAQAPGLFFPIVLQTTTAVWLWVGRALAGGTHFAKVTYGLLLQVGRLRNR